MINALRRPDREDVLREIREGLYEKTKTQKEIEAKIAQQERARDFGLENNDKL
jgi:hypothetical protein